MATEQDVQMNGNAEFEQQSAAAGGNAEVPKDEVGWYFVEQYYTTLSRNPERLFLFYNKRSQYVWGEEAEKIKVRIGQKEIDDRIKELGLQDSKVRVNNVDSQGSDKNIVIQVLGEISGKAATSLRKFAQTFVLAEQPNGYFLLNDIFRYISEEDEDFEGEQTAQPLADSGYQEPVHTAVPGVSSTEPETMGKGEDPAEKEQNAEILGQHIERAIEEEAPAGAVNGADVPPPYSTVEAEDAPVAVATSEDPAVDTATVATAPEAIANAPTGETKQAPAPKPASWANLFTGSISAAAAAAPTAAPAVAPAQPKSAPASRAQNNAAAAVVPVPQDNIEASTPVSSGSEWQTQESSKKPTRPAHNQNNANEGTVRGFVKNVNENIDAGALRSALNKVSELLYFDINRQKNCAFIEYASYAAFQTAVNANPYEIGGVSLNVEERRRPQSTGVFNNVGRGGPGGRGRGNMDRGRGGVGGRGGRGGAASRGRGGAPQAA